MLVSNLRVTLDRYNTPYTKVLFVVALAILGVSMIAVIFAAGPSRSFEAESGTLSGSAQKISDQQASDGQAIIFNPAPPPSSNGTYPLKASDNGRYLLTADNKFYYYIADAGWFAPARMNQADIVTYLNDRKSKGFNTIQVSVLMFPNLGTLPNVYGASPFINNLDISQPREVGARTSNANSSDYDYWDHIDYIIDQAANRDMQINLIPSWYGWAGWDWRGYVSNSNATAYGTFLGKRFGDKPNIMWTLGGDNNPDLSGSGVSNVPAGKDTSDKTQATRNMGQAIRNNESIRHLMSYHTDRTFSSSDFFHNDSWHTVSFAYSDELPYKIVQPTYNRANPKPIINPEAFYDARETLDRTVPANTLLDDRGLRAQAYWTFLSGGVGFAYGHEQVWDVNSVWKNALNANSSNDIKRLATFFDKYRTELVPDHRANNTVKLLTGGYGTVNTTNYSTSAIAKNNSVGLAYFPNNRSGIVVNMTALGGGNIKLSWFNPANGSTTDAGTFPASGTRSVSYPAGFQDAVLVAEKQ